MTTGCMSGVYWFLRFASRDSDRGGGGSGGSGVNASSSSTKESKKMEQRIGKKKSEIARTRVLLRTRRQNHEETKLALRSVLSSSASSVLNETSSQEIKEISELESALHLLTRELQTMTHSQAMQSLFTLEDAQESEEMLGMTETAVHNMEKRQFVASQKDVLLDRDDGIHRQMEVNREKDRAMEMEMGKQVERQPLVLREQMLLQSQMAHPLAPRQSHSHPHSHPQHSRQQQQQHTQQKQPNVHQIYQMT